MVLRGSGRSWSGFVVAGIACAALLAPGSAGAANVVNGDFETGNLQGWSVHRSLEAGNWFAYKGTDEPYVVKRSPPPPQPQVDPPQAPPQGKYAAGTDEINPDTLILYQDVALPAGQSQTLTLLAYYSSSVPIAVPGSGTLSVESEALEGQANQQYRIDVVKPEAPLDSVDPNDILRTVFRTVPGSPKTMLPTRLSADLSAFAGQTVRLRFAVAAHEEILTAGVDDVAISSGGATGGAKGKDGKGGSSPGAKVQFGLGKLKFNRANGSAILPVKVPGAGVIKAKDAKKGTKLINSVSTRMVRAGTAKLALRPTKAALATLKREHKLRVKVAVTFTPRGDPSETAILPVVLKLDSPRR